MKSTREYIREYIKEFEERNGKSPDDEVCFLTGMGLVLTRDENAELITVKDEEKQKAKEKEIEFQKRQEILAKKKLRLAEIEKWEKLEREEKEIQRKIDELKDIK